MTRDDFLAADWPAPAHIKAGTTLRSGGKSAAPYDSLNLGAHTEDDADAVAHNRAQLRDVLSLPAEPAWLDQVHGIEVANADQPIKGSADAAIGSAADAVCAVLTADCLPVVFCDKKGTRWAVAHAGWRGLAAGVLEATVDALEIKPADLMAWMGPAIGQSHFEVGAEVRAAFVDACSDDFSAFKEGAKPGKFRADIYALARSRLSRHAVKAVYGGGWCTADDDRFYSYRQARETGRMATLIWSTGNS